LEVTVDQIRDPELRVGETQPEYAHGFALESIRSGLERILGSRTFRSAQSQKEFLRYVVEQTLANRGSCLKEYMVGAEALGRGEDFDPRLDPIVRTQARKLRARLAKYYETEGRDDPLRIEFRKGSYAVHIRRTDAQDAPQVPAEPEPEPEHSSSAPAEIAVAVAPQDSGQPSRPTLLAVQSLWRWKVLAISMAALALASVCSAAVYMLRTGGRLSGRAAETPSIAVIPFVNLGDPSTDEFLSDGLTDELIDSLREVPGLQVVARTSTFRYKGKAVEIRAISQELHVGTVLLGTVRRDGDRLQINVQLDSSADGYHLWSGNYDRSASDARMVEWEIARAVTNVLGTAMVRGQQRELERAFPKLVSPAPGAYQDYLKGLYFWNKLSADSLNTAVQYFQQAIAEDPSFARAYAALADCYVMMPQVAIQPAPGAIAKIRSAALRALELDSSLGEPHFDLAVSAEHEFDWATAEVEFKKGLKLSPANAVGHLWYAKYLAVMGRKDEVLAERRIAAELDPVSPYAVQAVAGYLSVVGRYDEAIEQFRSALKLDPNFGLAHQGLGIAYLLKGMHGPAIDELQLANKWMTGPRRRALLGYAYGISGRTAEAKAILDDLLAQSRSGTIPALAIAEIFLGLGDKDQAFQWLERAIDQKDLEVTLQWDSPFEPLRSDPRYTRLLRRMKLA
jgi:TolB-like protein/tetratricopeptide (TPR) repeat protein